MFERVGSKRNAEWQKGHNFIRHFFPFFRALGLLPKDGEKIIFPEVTRKEADNDLVHCAKYLINYGFYKFGVEVIIFIFLF